MDGLPQASQAQINAMNKAAKEKYGIDDDATETHETHATQEEVSEPSESATEQTEEVSQDTSPSIQFSKAPTPQESFREVRAAKERAERERDELMRQLQEMQSKSSNSQTSHQIQQVKEDIQELTLNPDDLAEGKHLIQLVNKIKRLEEKLEESAQKSYLSTTEMKVKNDFPDFEKVASFENLKRLREQDPDLADAILNTKDPYKQHALAYKMVKQMGIYREDKYEEDRERAQRNANKPKPLTSISPQQGESPLSKANAFANGLTDELKKQLAQEMYEARKRM